ncbi:MAG: PD-(D/E)XK nuclease family protein [Planctomycetes bacterium]|nr:PD-(D/E)XK nuclease family protein [Planctomycetota bacterium]
MAELINTFSWSVSASRDFDECRRKRYLARYAMWNGWKDQATDIQRAAYRLSKMENRFILQGNAVEMAVIWAIRQQQEGKAVTMDQAYAVAARPFLNQCWKESSKKMWKSNPKKFCCLQEHYYPEHNTQPESEMTARMIDEIKQCLSNFIQEGLPRFKGIEEAQEVKIATVDSGDPESFQFEGLKIYAIPDYVYKKDDQIHIHDWKSGNPRPFHNDQMALYSLWANVKHNAPVGNIHVHLEYLLSGTVQSAVLTKNEFQKISRLIRCSVAEMAEYLVDGDIRKNKPLPQEDWEMAADIYACKRCKFFELCKPELGNI